MVIGTSFAQMRPTPATAAGPTQTEPVVTDAAFLAVTLLAAGSSDSTAKGIASLAAATAAGGTVQASASSPNALAALAVEMIECSSSSTQKLAMSEAALGLMARDPSAAATARLGMEASAAVSDTSQKLGIRLRALAAVTSHTPGEIADLGLGFLAACGGSSSNASSTAPAVLAALEQAGARSHVETAREMLNGSLSSTTSRVAVLRHTLEAVKNGASDETKQVAALVHGIVADVGANSSSDGVETARGALRAVRERASDAEKTYIDFIVDVAAPTVTTSSSTQKGLLLHGLDDLQDGWSDDLETRCRSAAAFASTSTDVTMRASVLERGLAWASQAALEPQTTHAATVLGEMASKASSANARAQILAAAVGALPQADTVDWPLIAVGKAMIGAQVDAAYLEPIVTALLQEVAAQASSTDARNEARDALGRMRPDIGMTRRVQVGREALDQMSGLIHQQTQIARMAGISVSNAAPPPRVERLDDSVVIAGVKVAVNAASQASPAAR